MLEEPAMEIAKIFGKHRSSAIVTRSWKHNAEVVIADIRRKIIADHALGSSAGEFIHDRGFKHF
ncbi:hypothetical protein D3C74_166820 [compost metagenome]